MSPVSDRGDVTCAGCPLNLLDVMVAPSGSRTVLEEVRVLKNGLDVVCSAIECGRGHRHTRIAFAVFRNVDGRLRPHPGCTALQTLLPQASATRMKSKSSSGRSAKSRHAATPPEETEVPPRIRNSAASLTVLENACKEHLSTRTGMHVRARDATCCRGSRGL